MKLTPRQMAVRGREMAGLLLHALEGERMVARFVDTYAVEFERAVWTAYAGQYREMLVNIRREALLAMTAWTEEDLPRFLGAPPRRRTAVSRRKSKRARKPAPRPMDEENDGALIFRHEFMATLSQMLGWHGNDREEFQRDLRLYRKLFAGTGSLHTSRQARLHVEGPFVDRCGVLLDPSMLDKARLAAARFQSQLRVTARTLLKQLFSRRREN